ncbi:hypothetical protein [Mesorhizobium sp. M0907]|uniref:hypothetical protein n=1 Tax=Mesorhizobium sp. M0907 TaxID=2957023 RepID=UPI00333CF37B
MILNRFIGWNRNAAAWLEHHFPQIFGAPSYKAELERRIAEDVARLKPSAILEVGGIDRPLLERGADFTYIGLDIEEKRTAIASTISLSSSRSSGPLMSRRTCSFRSH